MLEIIQKTLIEDIYKGTRKLGKYLDAKYPNIDERIDIFVGNRRFGQLDYLKSVYSVVAQILGDEYFEKIALEFVDISIQSSGNRHEYGAGFQEFLQAHPRTSNINYVGEIAAIEWAHFRAFLAEDSFAVSLAHIQSKLGNSEKFGIDLAPSASMFSTRCNSLEIWKAHQKIDFDSIVLIHQTEDYICWRNANDEILFSPIGSLMLKFLENPELGVDFLGTLEQTLESDDDSSKTHEFQIQFAQLVNGELFVLKEDKKCKIF